MADLRSCLQLAAQALRHTENYLQTNTRSIGLVITADEVIALPG